MMEAPVIIMYDLFTSYILIYMPLQKAIEFNSWPIKLKYATTYIFFCLFIILRVHVHTQGSEFQGTTK